MRLTIPKDVLLDIADIFDELTPRNKIDHAILLIRKRYAGNHNFWPDVANDIRRSIEFEQRVELLDAAQAEQLEANAEGDHIRDDVGQELIAIKKVVDEIVADIKPEYTLKQTRQKRTNLVPQNV